MVVPEEEVLVNPLDNLDLVEENKESPEAEKAEDNTQQDKGKQEEKPEEKGKVEEPEKTPEQLALEKRHAEQKAGEEKEVMRLRTMLIDAEEVKARADANSLIELHAKDPKLANEVAKRCGYDNFADAKAFITGIPAEPEAEEAKATEVTEDFETMYQKRKAEETHTEAIAEAKAMFDDLAPDQKAQALAEFDELAEGKTLTHAKAMKFAELVSLSLNKGKTKTENFQRAVKAMTTTGVPSNSKPQNNNDEMIVIDGKLVSLSSKPIK